MGHRILAGPLRLLIIPLEVAQICGVPLLDLLMLTPLSFGVAISASYLGLFVPTASIDYVGVTVYYSIPLPVTIGSFTATPKAGYNHIAWETYSEVNNELFIVQKSNNGSEFYDVATLLGKGNS